jgi:hypothetical protein
MQLFEIFNLIDKEQPGGLVTDYILKQVLYIVKQERYRLI